MIIKLRHSGQQPQLKQISEQRSLIRKREREREREGGRGRNARLEWPGDVIDNLDWLM